MTLDVCDNNSRERILQTTTVKNMKDCLNIE